MVLSPVRLSLANSCILPPTHKTFNYIELVDVPSLHSLYIKVCVERVRQIVLTVLMYLTCIIPKLNAILDNYI